MRRGNMAMVPDAREREAVNNPNIETHKCLDCHIEFLNCVYQNFWGCPECWSRNTIVTKEASALEVLTGEMRRKTMEWYSKMVESGKIEPMYVYSTKVHESDLLSEIDGKKGSVK